MEVVGDGIRGDGGDGRNGGAGMSQLRRKFFVGNKLVFFKGNLCMQDLRCRHCF